MNYNELQNSVELEASIGDLDIIVWDMKKQHKK